MHLIIKALDGLELELSAEELADALWLALQMQVARPQVQPKGVAPTLAPHLEAQPVPAPTAPASEPESPLPGRTQTTQNLVSERPQRHKRSSNALYTRSTHKLASKPLARHGQLLKIPDAPPLPEALRLARALRPLLRRVPSYSHFVLDEEATVRKMADQGLWLPQFLPAPERSFDLALVIDESSSMQLWAGVVAELRRMFEYHGAFVNVHTWWLATELPDGAVQLYAAPPNQQQREQANPRVLLDRQQRRLIMVLSDCVAQSWYNGEVAHILALWGKLNLVTIMQMLPERLWQRTALAFATPVYLRSWLTGVPSTRLRTKSVPQWFLPDPAYQPAVAVISLETNAVARWAQAVAGTSSAWIIGRSFDSEPLVEIDDEPTDTSDLPLAPLPLTPPQRVGRFRATASPLAYRLAEVMAALPVSLPVVRLAQYTMLPAAGQAHVAEFFLGGLLRQITPAAEVRDPNEIEYDFIPGVREELLSAVPIALPLQVLRRISDYVEGWLGKFLDFQALLFDPAAIDDLIIPEHGVPFAEISIRVLRHLGGRYATLADALERKLRNDPTLSLSATQLASEDQRRQLREMVLDPNFTYRSEDHERFLDVPISRLDPSRRIFFDLGDGTEGIVPWYEMKTLSDEEFKALQPGDIHTVFMLRAATDQNLAILSIDKAAIEKIWRRLKQAQRDNEIIEGVVTMYNNGGLVVRVEGLQGFIPNRYIKELIDVPFQYLSAEKQHFLHQTLRLIIIECEPELGELILSSQIEEILANEQALKDFFATLQVGEIRDGIITRVLSYGILVDIGGAKGLVHKSEVDYDFINDFKSQFKVGDLLQVAILKFNSETRKIELSRKRALPDPWKNNTILEELHVGDVRDVRIVDIAKTAIIVDVDGLTGLIPLGELDTTDNETLSLSYNAGKIISAKIIQIDYEKRRLVLSCKRVVKASSPDPWKNNTIQEKLHVGDVRDVRIVDIAKTAIIVDVDGLAGIIPFKEFDYAATEILSLRYSIDKIISAKIINIDRKKKRMILSCKQIVVEKHNELSKEERKTFLEKRKTFLDEHKTALDEHKTPLDERKTVLDERKAALLGILSIGDIRDGFISQIVNFGVFVDIGGADGLVHISEWSFRRIEAGHIKRQFSIGDPVRVVVIDIELEKKRIALSRKRLLPDPWVGIETRYKVGSSHVTTVSSVSSFGIFCAIEEGVEGLIHKSKLLDDMEDSFQTAFQIGQAITVRIINIDEKKGRIGLSMRPVE